MLAAFAVLLVFQCLGEGIVFVLKLPVPGPVAGMLLLMAALIAFPRLQTLVEQAANTLLSHLSLLFVPAGVGIVAAAASGSGHWVAILVSLAVSTVLALAVTGLILRGMGGGDAQDKGEDKRV
ncbi:CidA/LrgA family protein [Massilia sp. ST3]|uniref:CidA/LrgA family protein n=1 Tax=Massilia sp. ST3 TaxID=2824903 RepID=UPI001B82465B|nr:CidA/LrgA family protein [Massilia sp. ST3]MBQ5946059.1 CidA/LrgA family protein [Massilia sp. ST3]